MDRDRAWFIPDGKPGRLQTGAKIDILEPNRGKCPIEAANGQPGASGKHKERAGWLFYLYGSHRIKTRATVVPIDGVARPEGVYAQGFENESRRGGEISRHETGLGRAVGAQKESAGTA